MRVCLCVCMYACVYCHTYLIVFTTNKLSNFEVDISVIIYLTSSHASPVLSSVSSNGGIAGEREGDKDD